MTEGENKPVFVDFEALNKKDEQTLGRPLTEQEENMMSEVYSTIIDALACGREIETTVKNIEESGGVVSEAVKAALGLVPPVN